MIIMKLNKSLVQLLFFITLGASCVPVTPQGQKEERDYASFTRESVRVVKMQIQPMESQGINYPEETLSFFHHYGADQIPGTLEFGRFRSGERNIAVYLFRPPGDAASGTVYLLHGYLDHSLSNIHLIRFLVEHNYNVAAFDLPGHGMSEGASVDIDDFREYADCLKRFKILTDQSLSEPWFALGHSTGSSVILEYQNLYQNDFKAIILTSPLVKSVGWQVTPLGLALAEPFMVNVGRRFGGSSSNREYEKFKKNDDPLQSGKVPFHWVYASMAWSSRMELIVPREDLVLHILQGKKDRVVDYRHNLDFLMEKYPHSDLIYYKEGGHSLFNELPAIRDKVYQDILQILESAD